MAVADLLLLLVEMFLQVVLYQTSIDLARLAGSARVGVAPGLRSRVRAGERGEGRMLAGVRD